MNAFVRWVLLVAVAAQAPQTPAQLAEQIAALAKQLAQMAAPVSSTSLVTTAAELTAAMKACKAVTLAPGTYAVNLVMTCGTIEGPGMAVLTPVDPLDATLTLPAGSGMSVKGVTVLGGPRETIVVGSNDVKTVDALPRRVRLEGLTVRPADPPVGGHRGIALHGIDVTVTGSRITGYWEAGRDSQGIWINNGPGPYTVTDNTVEASGENILTGGGDPGIVGMIPADIVIRGNTFRKPVEYKALGATVKNLVELKNARRVTIDGNTLDGWWPPTQAAPVQFTPRNQDGACTWCVVESVMFVGNTVKNAAGGFAVNILGTDDERPSGQTKDITIRGNLFQDATGGVQVLGGVAGAFVIDHNTLPAITSKVFSFDRIAGQPNMLTALTFTNNVLRSGTYGVTGDGSTSIGLASLTAFVTLTEWSGNVIEATAAVKWPAGQTTLAKGALASLLDPKTLKLLSGTAGY
jgi:hypothetical protein